MRQRIRLTTAQALLRFLDNQYVEFDGEITKFVHGIFGVFGHGCVVGVGQALEQGGHTLKFYQGHNEQGMALAATAYAKQLNRRAILPCLSSIGPGAMNMVTAAGTATANRIPLLLLPGDTFACRQPDPVLQQVEQFYSPGVTANDAFRPVCRFFERVERPEQLMAALLGAMRTLTDPAECGACCVALPQDAEGEAYEYPAYFFEKRVWHMDRRPPTQGQLSRAAAMIRAAKRPLIVCGGGVRYSEAWGELAAFAEATNAPITETQAGKGLVGHAHPLNLGGLGVTGGLAANRAARQADLIISVGSRLSDFTTCSKWGFSPDARLLSINVCAFDAIKMDAEAVIADARETLSALLPRVAGYQSAWGGEIGALKREWDAVIDGFYDERDEGELKQTQALACINRFMRDSDIAVGSSGSLPGDMQRIWRAGAPMTYHMEYGFSCMGYEVNGALGVKMAAPGREVYAMLGDGSYVMAHSELYTAIQEGLKLTLCVFDNRGWGCIENLQNAQGTDTFGTTFQARGDTGLLDGAALPIDFAKNAESYGAKGYTVRTMAELKAALADARGQKRSVVLDIKVAPGSMTPGYESWWRVGAAEVSESDAVRAAHAEQQKNIAKARLY